MDSNLIQIIQELEAARSAKNWDAAMVVARRGLLAFPGQTELLDALHSAQAHYVRDKLHSDVVLQLEVKGDYMTLFAVYQKLLSIFPESGKLKRLLKKVKKQIDRAQHKAHEQFFNSVELKMKEFVAAGEIEDALQACAEILAVEPANRRFLKWHRKLECLRAQGMDSRMELAFPDLFKRMKAEAAASPDLWLAL
jgi:tetratricopeptide (TPR) repeat protein